MGVLAGQRLEGVRCGEHPADAAVAVCARCGIFACLECVCSVAGSVWCAACARRPVEVSGERQVGVEVVRLLAALSWFCPPLAVVALAAGWHQRRRIRRGELAWSAEWHLRQAMRRTWGALILWGLLLGGLVAAFFFMPLL